jgi:hypothetical protein
MSRADDYRLKAAECRHESKTSLTPLDKQQWLRLAEHWMKMAETIEQEADD